MLSFTQHNYYIIHYKFIFFKFFPKESDILSVAGIIAEFNPLHNGHKYLIDCAKKESDTVVCVISGNFVQRGDVSIIPKFKRAESALLCGADLVAELPVPWSMSTAQNFALGGVSQLAALGVDTLYFGSECGNAELLEKIACILLNQDFNNALKAQIKSGETFAKVRTEVLREFCGNDADILCNPNDTLAIEYICSAKKLGLNFKFKAIKRLGIGHDSTSSAGCFASSSFIREKIIRKDFADISNFMPKESVEILTHSPVADLSQLDVAIMAGLKLCNEDLFVNLADVSEGLDKLIFKNTRASLSFNDLCDAVKSKRYTHARIRRIVLSAFLGIDSSYFLVEPPYVRILGMKNSALHLLMQVRKPVITKISQIEKLDIFSKKLFELENKINSVYALSLDDPSAFINEYSEKLIRV